MNRAEIERCKIIIIITGKNDECAMNIDGISAKKKVGKRIKHRYNKRSVSNREPNNNG